MKETVQDLIDSLNDIEDKSQPLYVTDITSGKKYLEIDLIMVDNNGNVRLVIET